MSVLYTTSVRNTGGRAGGWSEATDGSWKVEIASPDEQKKDPKPAATNPEVLFAAGYSACFNSALEHVLKEERFSYQKTEVTVTVHLYKDDRTGYSLGAEVAVKVDDLPQAENQKWADKAHLVCPYSKAMRDGVAVKVKGL